MKKNIDFKPIDIELNKYAEKETVKTNYEYVNLYDLAASLNKYFTDLREAYKLAEKLGKTTKYPNTAIRFAKKIVGSKYDDVELLFNDSDSIIKFKKNVELVMAMDEKKLSLSTVIKKPHDGVIEYDEKAVSEKYIEDNADILKKIFGILSNYSKDGYFIDNPDDLKVEFDDGFLKFTLKTIKGQVYVVPSLSDSFGDYDILTRMDINEELPEYITNYQNRVLSKIAIPITNLSAPLRVFIEDKVGFTIGRKH